MRRNILFMSIFAAMVLFSFYVFIKNSSQFIFADDKPSQLPPSPVYGTLPKGSVLYESCGGKAVDMLVSGSKVEIIKDRSRKWYYIRCKNKLGWVKREALKIPTDTRADKSLISENEFIEYANKNLKSITPHYVWVDISRQKIYILKNNKGWQLEKTIICSTGKNVSPSLRGNFTIGDRGKWFYSQRLGSGAKYWVRYSGSYLFHSVAMDKNQNITDPTLGQKSSSGCVRMSVEDALWFYNNIEKDTSVTIN